MSYQIDPLANTQYTPGWVGFDLLFVIIIIIIIIIISLHGIVILLGFFPDVWSPLQATVHLCGICC
jgi:hypothetical protein